MVMRFIDFIDRIDRGIVSYIHSSRIDEISVISLGVRDTLFTVFDHYFTRAGDNRFTSG